ncbi:MAG: electron transfer flavoprotein subunit beta/FixA family protein [Syntrophomonadaceae bacterium]|nr:electron transfer flavoprotein subunit beta/FixA family protein [Syntrophomonadaceae bacterium]
MLKIITCFKWVLDESDIKVAANGRDLILDRVGYKISDYDRNAIEEAVRLQEQYGGKVTAVTVGPPNARLSLKDALSRGPEEGLFIHDSAFKDLEPAQTAAVLAAAIESQGSYDLIICGEGSSDLYAQQVGPRLAEKLGLPAVTYVNKLSLEGNQLIAERRLEDGIEVVAVPLPALVTVLPEINTPRLPGLKQVLAAAKKPVISLTKSELSLDFAPSLQTIGIQAAATDRRRLKFGPEAEEIQKVVEALIREGVVS